MPLAYWNTAKALFWIIVRRPPADPLLDKDHEIALAAVLLSCHQFSRSNVLELTRLPLNLDLVRTPSVQAITTALDELSTALRAAHLFCPDADEMTVVQSSIEGFYIESNLAKNSALRSRRGWCKDNGLQRDATAKNSNRNLVTTRMASSLKPYRY